MSCVPMRIAAFSLFAGLLLAGCASQPEAPGSVGNAQMFAAFDNYEQFMGRWSRLLAPQLIAFPGIDGGDRVLDVGTGTIEEFADRIVATVEDRAARLPDTVEGS